ncbi:MAG: tRNA guanosine(34) transglycosylase Tgt [Patescibacteria group bacterium]|nr:tRNA guanosine(34) transglycosylase Tgt [Patescibacteria group bacterium]
MFKFTITKKSKKSRARLGLLKTSHGVIETPVMIPVATQASIKTLNSEQVKKTGSQLLICNTYHLRLRPGEKVIKSLGGLHQFMNWSKPLMTDSGGFQVFSLGFGRDFNVSKIIKGRVKSQIKAGQQPKLLKITKTGVWFRSHVDGRKIFLGPKESMEIQSALGADIIFAFDECPPPHANRAYVSDSVELTHKWAELCLKHHDKKQALYGIAQGGHFRDLRLKSARFIGSLPFDGFGIGGELGGSVLEMKKMLAWVTAELPEGKPRHMLGTGHPEDIPAIIASGCDTFDSIVPTHFGRHGTAFTSSGRLNLSNLIFLKDKKPLEPGCECEACTGYSRAYISHLFRSRELLGMQLLSIHNLTFFNRLVSDIRRKIEEGKF